jgi:hypothetical protein
MEQNRADGDDSQRDSHTHDATPQDQGSIDLCPARLWARLERVGGGDFAAATSRSSFEPVGS